MRYTTTRNRTQTMSGEWSSAIPFIYICCVPGMAEVPECFLGLHSRFGDRLLGIRVMYMFVYSEVLKGAI